MHINSAKLALLLLGTRSLAQSTLNSHNPLASAALSLSSTLPSPTASAGSNSSASLSASASSAVPTASTSPKSTVPHLDTKVDPTFGILGSVLLLSGAPLTFQGSRNRWTTYAISGTYAGALVISLVILKTRGLFLFASLVAGLFTGGCAVVWHVYCQHLVPSFAGFATGLWILSLRSDGLIGPLGFRYILVGGLAGLGFVVSTVPRLTTLSCLVGTSIVGATATVLGIDCLTTQGLKEFFLINLGFVSLFPKLQGHYPITVPLQVELACIPFLSIIGTAVQMKFYKLLLRKARDLRQADRERDEEEKARGVTSSARIESEMSEWERKHAGSVRGTSIQGTDSTLMGSGQLDYLPRIEDLGKQRRETIRAKGKSTAPSPPSEFQHYLETRKVVVGQPKVPLPDQRRSAVSLPPLAHLAPTPTTSESAAVNGSGSSSSSNDVPLALARPATSASLASQARPRPTSTFSTSSKPARPRPTSLAFPSQSEPILSTRKLGEIGRRSTLLDLNEDDDDTPLSVAQRRQSAGPERIVVHNWTNGAPKARAARPPSGPRMMELEELEAKKRRSLALIQHGVKAELEANEVRLRAERERQKFAERQAALSRLDKAENRRQSVGSFTNLLKLAAPAGPVEQPRPAQTMVNRSAPGFEGAPRQRTNFSPTKNFEQQPLRRASMGNLLDQARAPLAEFGARVHSNGERAPIERSVQHSRRESRSLSTFDGFSDGPIRGGTAGSRLPPGAGAPVASCRR